MQTNTLNMLLVWSKVFVLIVELFPSTGVIWVIGVRLHISILFMEWGANALKSWKVGRGQKKAENPWNTQYKN